MLVNGEKTKVLEEMEIFKGISKGDLVRISDISSEAKFPKKKVVFEVGDIGDYLMVIIRGKVKVHRNGTIITNLSAGACFGEMSIFSSEKRSASITTESECVLLKISQDDFLQVLSHNTPLLKNIIGVLSSRIRETNDLLFQKMRDCTEIWEKGTALH